MIGSGKRSCPKRIALPVFASDPLSSVAYAPGEVLLVLSIAGVSAYHFSPWIAVAVVVLMFTVVASYRQNVHAYPSGGGDYEVANTNLGPKAGLTVASALLVDYVLTVAVSISSGIENLGSAIPFVVEHKVLCAVAVIVLLTLMNLRGVKESGQALRDPDVRLRRGRLHHDRVGRVPRARPRRHHAGADRRLTRSRPSTRASPASRWSSCCCAPSPPAVPRSPASRRSATASPPSASPSSKNAATTLALMGLLAVTMFCGIIGLAMATKVRMAENPAVDLLEQRRRGRRRATSRTR